MWPAGLVVLVTVLVLLAVLPPLRAIPWSLLHWDYEARQYALPLTLDAYGQFFTAHRGGLVFHGFVLAMVTTGLVMLGTTPLAFAFRTSRLFRWVAVVEVVMICPFLFSHVLRVFALRSLLQQGGLFRAIAGFLPLPQAIRNELLFSDLSVVVGLSFSFAPLYVLPLLQALRSVSQSVIDCGRDCALSWFDVHRRLLLPLTVRGMVGGSILMLVVVWFSSIEPGILGAKRSIVAMLQDLVATQKFPETFAFAIVPAVLSVAMVLALFWWVRPERLLVSDKRD